MSRWKVWVCLEGEYDDVEADTAEEAFQIASDDTMAGGDWAWSATLIEEDSDDV